MKWDVAVALAVGDGRERFALDVAFARDATRLVVQGPSGAGKSLTLQAIAGLLRPDRGHVRVDAETLYDSARSIEVPARARRFGVVFQEYALFPHLTVRQNVAFALAAGWRNPPRDAADERVERWLRSLEIEGLGARYPDQLSGGQRQRVALARALVAEPRALLFDEPFAALDAPLRARLRAELRELQSRHGWPMLFITHDPADVAALADDVVSIESGRVALPVALEPS